MAALWLSMGRFVWPTCTETGVSGRKALGYVTSDDADLAHRSPCMWSITGNDDLPSWAPSSVRRWQAVRVRVGPRHASPTVVLSLRKDAGVFKVFGQHDSKDLNRIRYYNPRIEVLTSAEHARSCEMQANEWASRRSISKLRQDRGEPSSERLSAGVVLTRAHVRAGAQGSLRPPLAIRS